MNFNVSRVITSKRWKHTSISPQTFHKVMLGTMSSNVIIVLLSKLSVAFLNELLTSRAAMETLY